MAEQQRTVARLRGSTPRRLSSRLAVGAWGLIALLAALTVAVVAPTRSAPRPQWHPWAFALVDPLLCVAFAVPGLVVASRRPRNPAGWLLLLAGFGMALDNLARAYGVYAISRGLPGGAVAAAVTSWLFVFVSFPVFFLFLLLPDGRFPSPQWRIAAWYVGASAMLMLLVAVLLPGPAGYDYFPSVDNPLGVPALSFLRAITGPVSILFVLCPFLLAVASLLFRFHACRGVERQRLKWVAFAALVAVTLVPLGVAWQGVVESIATDVAAVVFSTGIMIAIMRHRLLDIDRVLSRSMLYVALTASTVGLYAASVSVFGSALSGAVPGAVSVLATGTVAVALQPLHSFLRRLMSRLVYGLRDDPYAVLAELGRRMEVTGDPQRVLPQAAATLADALRLPYAAVELRGSSTDGPVLPTARYGTEVPDVQRLALIHQGEEVGSLVVGARSPGESFSAADLRLLQDVARHIAQAAAGVRLTLTMLRSGQQLIAVRAQERRRLGRELHDEVNSVLNEVVWGLQAARKWLRADPDQTDELLGAGLARTHEGVEAVRRIALGLRSPVDEVGLEGAIRAFAERCPLPVKVQLPEKGLPELPAAVEEAAYWIVVEALTNVVRHARASRCSTSLEIRQALTVTVTDDGRGLPTPLRPGVGLGSMRERAAEIGGTCHIHSPQHGGTEVTTHLPHTLPGTHPTNRPSHRAGSSRG